MAGRARLSYQDPMALTGRELEVLHELAQGYNNNDIARTLGIDERTVRTHVSTILGKLGVKSRTAAVIVAMRRGLVPLPVPSGNDVAALRSRLANLTAQLDLLGSKAHLLLDDIMEVEAGIDVADEVTKQRSKRQ